jgi:hypothetical protein
MVHGTNEAAWSTLLLLAALAFERVIAGLMRTAFTESPAIAFKAGDIAGILLLRPLTVPVTKLFLPALAAATILLLAAALEALSALWLKRLRLRTRCLDGPYRLSCSLIATRLSALWSVAFGLALAAPTAAALGLPHAMGNILAGKLCIAVLLDG